MIGGPEVTCSPLIGCGQGDLVNNILDLVYHLSKGRNCLVHCAGGTGR